MNVQVELNKNLVFQLVLDLLQRFAPPGDVNEQGLRLALFEMDLNLESLLPALAEIREQQVRGRAGNYQRLLKLFATKKLVWATTVGIIKACKYKPDEAERVIEEVEVKSREETELSQIALALAPNGFDAEAAVAKLQKDRRAELLERHGLPTIWAEQDWPDLENEIQGFVYFRRGENQLLMELAERLPRVPPKELFDSLKQTPSEVRITDRREAMVEVFGHHLKNLGLDAFKASSVSAAMLAKARGLDDQLLPMANQLGSALGKTMSLARAIHLLSHYPKSVEDLDEKEEVLDCLRSMATPLGFPESHLDHVSLNQLTQIGRLPKEAIATFVETAPRYLEQNVDPELLIALGEDDKWNPLPQEAKDLVLDLSVNFDDTPVETLVELLSQRPFDPFLQLPTERGKLGEFFKDLIAWTNEEVLESEFVASYKAAYAHRAFGISPNVGEIRWLDLSSLLSIKTRASELEDVQLLSAYPIKDLTLKQCLDYACNKFGFFGLTKEELEYLHEGHRLSVTEIGDEAKADELTFSEALSASLQTWLSKDLEAMGLMDKSAKRVKRWPEIIDQKSMKKWLLTTRVPLAAYKRLGKLWLAKGETEQAALRHEKQLFNQGRGDIPGLRAKKPLLVSKT